MLKNDWKILIENLLKKVVKIIKHMKCQKVVINICIIESEWKDKITLISWRKKKTRKTKERELNISFDN